MTPSTQPYQVRYQPESDALSWEKASLLTDFAFPWENRPGSPTEFRALWTRQALHFRFDCQESGLVLADGENDQEKVIGSDRVEIFLAPDLDLQPYYCLEMDPRGAILDYRARFHRVFDWDWQCEGLVIATEIEDEHYRVEGSIPLETLRTLGVLKPQNREIIAGLYRADFSRKADGSVHQGWMAWIDPGTKTPDFHVPGSFGVLELEAPN